MLNDEKIDGQKKVIELQDRFIDKNEEKLIKSIKTAVKSELQPYSSVLQKSSVDEL